MDIRGKTTAGLTGSAQMLQRNIDRLPALPSAQDISIA
jgi:hypothetical protein